MLPFKRVKSYLAPPMFYVEKYGNHKLEQGFLKTFFAGQSKKYFDP